jgi:hypothetical protein
VCVDVNDNDLAYLEAMHLSVEILGAFGLPCVRPFHPGCNVIHCFVFGVSHRGFGRGSSARGIMPLVKYLYGLYIAYSMILCSLSYAAIQSSS